ncbi:MAG: cytochrome c3 family protein [Pirellulaceae bacterium]
MKDSARATLVVSSLLWAITVVVAAQSTGAPGTPAYVPPAPEQPLPFSHQTHLALSLDCAQCHTMPEPGEAATFPSTDTCMGCHTSVASDRPAIQELAAAHASGASIAWRRVYNLPDYVFFSHKTHVSTAGGTCETCHGVVAEMPVMQRVKDTSMAACVTCHEANAAPTGCNTCHEPR